MPINYIREGADTFGLNSALAGQVVTRKSGLWRASHVFTPTEQTGTTYTAATGDHVLSNIASNLQTITLPSAAAAGNGGSVRVTKTDMSTNYARVNAPTGHLNGVSIPTTISTNVDRNPSSNGAIASGQNVRCDATTGGFTISLPAATNNSLVRITKTDTSVNAVIIQPPSGTIDGDKTAVVNSQHQALFFYADGTAWHYLPETYSIVRGTLSTLTFVSDGTNWWTVE